MDDTNRMWSGEAKSVATVIRRWVELGARVIVNYSLVLYNLILCGFVCFLCHFFTFFVVVLKFCVLFSEIFAKVSKNN